MKVLLDNKETLIDCNGKIENVKPSNNVGISFADYLCLPANCNATYNWTITGPIPQSGTTNTITNANFSSPGTYKVTMIPMCGSKKCEPCEITIVVKSETSCICGYMWFPGKYQISGGVMQSVSVGQTINLPVPSAINFDFNGAFGCNPPGSECPPIYNWEITGPGLNNVNQSSANPVFSQYFPQPNSTYNVKMTATCGTEKCSGPSFTVKTGGTINCQCGSWTGGIRVDGSGMGCNSFLIVEFNKGYRSVQGPTMSCNPNVQNCSPQYSYVVKLNGITVHSGSGNSFSNFYFQSNKNYTIIFNANCGIEVCQPCQRTIRIKSSIFGGLGNVSFGNIGIKNPNVGPSIFNPSGSVRPDFKWNSSISPGKQGNLVLMEVTPGMSTGDLSELVKELQEKEPLFEVSVISDRTSYPKEAPDLSSGKYYIWVVYEAGESDGEATILNAGFFKAGLTEEGKEIINCDDCEKMCPGGRCWNINGKCYCF